MKNTKRFVSLMVVLMMIAALFPAMPKKEVRADVENVIAHDPDELREYLQKDGDVNIKLADAVFYSQYPNWDSYRRMRKQYPESEFEGDMPVWAELGSGVKTLDLNGRLLEVEVDDLKAQQAFLFQIPFGAKLVVNDSRGTGEIFFNGYMYAATKGTAGLHEAALKYEQHRNGFWVRGGELEFNGGTLVGGRSKKRYLGYGIQSGLYAECFDTAGQGRYDGEARQQISCCGIYMSDGKTVINGGTIEGRGYQQLGYVLERGHVDVKGYMDDPMWWESSLSYESNSAILAHGGVLTINNGRIVGRGNANAVDINYKEATAVIRGGTFEVYELDNIIIPGPFFTNEDDFQYIKYPLIEPVFLSLVSCEVSGGRLGVSKSYIDFPEVNVIQDGVKLDKPEEIDPYFAKKIEISPRDDKDIELYNYTYGEPVNKTIAWDGTSDLFVTADAPAYWPTSEIPFNKEDGRLVRFMSARAQSSKSVGVTAGISIGGMTVSSGGESVGIEKYLLTNDILDTDTQKLSFNIKYLKPDGLAAGDSFMITVIWSDNLYDATKNPSLSQTNSTSFVVEIHEAVNILQHPQSETVTEKGTNVTLTAKAENAKGAYWTKTNAYGQQVVDGGTFDPSTGVAKLPVEVKENAGYVCHFVGELNEVSTNMAGLSIVATPVLAEDEIREVEWSALISPCYFTASLAASGDCIAQRWYYKQNLEDEWTQLQPVEGKRSLYMRNTLAVVNPNEDEDNGYYRLEGDYRLADGSVVTVRTGAYHVTVVDAFTSDTVTSLNIAGMPELYCGDQAPSSGTLTALLKTDDERMTITKFEWNESDLDSAGNFKCSYTRFKMTITNPPYKIGFVDNGEGNGIFMVTIDGREYPVYGTVDTTAHGVEVEGYWPTDDVVDEVFFENASFDLHQGDTVSIELDPTVVCHKRHQEAGLNHTSVVRYALYAPETFPLPEGLTLDTETGVISGTVTQEPSISGFTVYVDCYVDDSENCSRTPVTFYVLKEMEKMILPTKKAEIIHQHEYGAWADTGDGATHKHVCSCGDEKVQPHVWDEGVVTVAPTTTAEGQITYTCKDCGASYTDKLDKLTLEKVEETAATCQLSGVKAHYVDPDSGKIYEDAEGKILIENIDTLLLPMEKHSWGDWVVTKEATPEEPGEETRTCSTCGEKETRTLSYVDPAKNDGMIYRIVSNSDSWTSGDLVITVKRNVDDSTCFSHFRGVAVDGYPLKRDEEYSAVAGSTVITIPEVTMKRITKGSHTVTITFDDGKIEMTLNVDPKTEDGAGTPANGNAGTNKALTARPKTGDIAGKEQSLAKVFLILSGVAGAAFLVLEKKKKHEA